MHQMTLQAFRDKAKADEDFWFSRHKDAQTDDDLHNFGWLWIHAKQMREKLDSMLASSLNAKEVIGK